MTIARIGVFGAVVWSLFIVLMGAALIGSYHAAAKEGIPKQAAILTAAITAVALLLFNVLVYLFETQLTLIAKIEAGTLEVIHGRRIGTRKARTFAFENLEGASVEDFGEESIAAVLHVKAKKKKEREIPIFPTVIGDDARKVVAFVQDALTSWRALTSKSES